MQARLAQNPAAVQMLQTLLVPANALPPAGAAAPRVSSRVTIEELPADAPQQVPAVFSESSVATSVPMISLPATAPLGRLPSGAVPPANGWANKPVAPPVLGEPSQLGKRKAAWDSLGATAPDGISSHKRFRSPAVEQSVDPMEMD